MSNQNIGVFFGSRSPEHDVSIITASLIISTLRKMGKNPIPVYLNKDGDWYLGAPLGNLNFFHNLTSAKLAPFGGWRLNLSSPSKNKLIFSRSSWFQSKQITIDIAFPAFHGLNGEDGTIQGVFELMNIPYVGCDVPSSAITMDKVLTKFAFAKFDIPTPPFIYFTSSEWRNSQSSLLKTIADYLNYPVFVKPARLGSSIAIAKVKNESELKDSVAVSLRFDDKVLIEQAVPNAKDLTCAVLESPDNEPQVSLIQESSFVKDFFSYEDKYLNDGGAQLGRDDKNITIPANIPEDKTELIQKYSLRLFKKMNLGGSCRIDFLYDPKSESVFANEINSIPGTLYHHLWQKSGVELPEILNRLLDGASRRFFLKSDFINAFQSDILSRANSAKLKIDDQSS